MLFRYGFRRATTFLCLNASSLHYCPRKANTAAHTLSRHGFHVVGVTILTSFIDLPCEVRGALSLDARVPRLRL